MLKINTPAASVSTVASTVASKGKYEACSQSDVDAMLLLNGGSDTIIVEAIVQSLPDTENRTTVTMKQTNFKFMNVQFVNPILGELEATSDAQVKLFERIFAGTTSCNINISEMEVIDKTENMPSYTYTDKIEYTPGEKKNTISVEGLVMKLQLEYKIGLVSTPLGEKEIVKGSTQKVLNAIIHEGYKSITLVPWGSERTIVPTTYSTFDF